MRTGWLLAGATFLLAAACAPAPRPAAVGVPATSVVPPQLVPGATPPTRPPLTPAVAVSPLPTAAASPEPSPETSPSPAATAGPVLHPTLPRVGVTPSPAATPGR
jgi:hypothetical protein